jgi:hypothetical protein
MGNKCGVVSDFATHSTSGNALFGFAGTTFGVVAAFIGTEKAATG